MLCWNICMYLFYLRSYFILLLWDRTCISKVIKNCRLHTVIFPDNSVNKESPCNAWDPGSIPGSRRSPREGNGNSLQYSCLENPTGRGAWRPLRYEIHSSPVCLQGSPAIACMLSLFSRVPLCDPMDCSPPGSSVHGNSPDKHTGVGCHALLQGTFLTQGLNHVSPALQVHSLPTESPEKPSPAFATITFQNVVSKKT